MQLFKTKIWSWVDIVLLKWCVLFFGMIVGACIPDFVIQHVWVFLIAAVLLAIKPTFTYFKD